MDFLHDTLAHRQRIRILTAIDVFSRACVVLEPSTTIRGSDVARILADTGSGCGPPGRILRRRRNGVHSKALDNRAYGNRVELDFSRTGKPTDNPCLEAFNATLRRECVAQHWFIGLEDARTSLYRRADQLL